MIINGVERGFDFTIGAYSSLAKLCRNNDLSHFEELFMGSTAETVDNLLSIAMILNKAYESKRRYNGESAMRPLDREELENLGISDLKVLQSEIMAVMTAKGEVEIETKKNETRESV